MLSARGPVCAAGAVRIRLRLTGSELRGGEVEERPTVFNKDPAICYLLQWIPRNPAIAPTTIAALREYVSDHSIMNLHWHV